MERIQHPVPEGAFVLNENGLLADRQGGKTSIWTARLRVPDWVLSMFQSHCADAVPCVCQVTPSVCGSVSGQGAAPPSEAGREVPV